jgi:hypothetical protein
MGRKSRGRTQERVGGLRRYRTPPVDKRKSYPSRVGATTDVAGLCQALTASGQHCSRPATVLLGDRAFCEQHANRARA